MCYYDDDFYNEPSEFEQQVLEFKDAIAKSVKDDFIEKMERLEKENAELQEVKKNFNEIKADYQDKVRELDHQHLGSFFISYLLTGATHSSILEER